MFGLKFTDKLLLDSPETMTGPFFIQEPEDAYVVKNRPATLTCEAGNVLQIHFKCNGERVQSKEYGVHAYYDPMSGKFDHVRTTMQS